MSEMLVLNELDKRLLMELQYSFPLDPEPFKIVGQRLGISESDVISRVKALIDAGVIKRVGMYVSFRAKGMDSALVAASIHPANLEKFRKIALNIKEITHNYIRIHPKYNVWYVIKAENREKLTKWIDDLMKEVNAEDYVILYSERTVKLSVKYDVYRGVSYSEPNVPADTGTVSVPKEVLTELSKPLPITPRPFMEVARKVGMTEEELIDLIAKLRDKGAIRDYGATIVGESVGIKENGMMMISAEDCESTCNKLAELRETTHVVLRSSNKSWNYLCYAMLHARSKSTILEVASSIAEKLNVRGYMILFSVENLKPGIVI
ncbi:MAG: Lrp/AsnC family transcriptional regulator [Sulfolobus sp.]|nr:Lrp/AsnC family transcriptional regulator [Sulfolobus sp.]